MSFFYYLGNTIVIQKYVFYNLFTTIIRQSRSEHEYYYKDYSGLGTERNFLPLLNSLEC